MSDLGELARSMRDRMPWPVGRRILEENEVERGRGWEKTLEKLSDDRVDRSEKVEPIRASLLEHVLCGEKLSRFYHLESEDMEALRVAALGLHVPESTFKKRFPLVIAETDLAELPIGHTLVSVETTDQGIGIVFSSIRNVTVRVELQPEDFPDSSIAMMSNFDEIVGVKNKRVQGLDIIWIPLEGNFVEVRVDFPNGMLRAAGEYAHDHVKTAISTILDNDFLIRPVNLFDLIARMYHDSSEGSVVELAFGATTAALKHEKMRRGSFSLRDESYHRGGLAALREPISPFKVSIEWDRKIDEKLVSKPELNLHANSRIGGAEQPILLDAIVRNCMGLGDYEFVRGRILRHLMQIIEIDQKKT